MFVRIEKVHTPGQLREFIDLPFRLYREDRNFVPPLISERKKFLDRNRNPFFLHSQADYFLARSSEGKVVGRIAAIHNTNHVKFHQELVGFFGLFECIDDPDTAKMLFDTAAKWLRGKGLQIMRGPANFSTNDDIGLLVDGFQLPPVIMMPYNPEYYPELVERYGFKKVKDVYAYYYESKDWHIPDRLKRAAEMLEKRNKFTIRTMNMKEFDQEVKLIRKIYNSAWELNWGFIPMTEEEFYHLAKDLKQVVDPELCLLAEINGEPVGFSLAIPDLNQALIKIKGRLFPFGLFKLLYYSRKIDMVRVLTMGVIKPHRLLGIDTSFYYHTFKNGFAKGFRRGEFSWILEDNAAMNQALQKMGAKIYKTYRLYDYYL